VAHSDNKTVSDFVCLASYFWRSCLLMASRNTTVYRDYGISLTVYYHFLIPRLPTAVASSVLYQIIIHYSLIQFQANVHQSWLGSGRSAANVGRIETNEFAKYNLQTSQ